MCLDAKAALLTELLKPGRDAHLVEEDIYSTILDSTRKHSYDSKAAFYDLIVGNSLYNRFVWGDSPTNYSAFARKALTNSSDSVTLDAGCGSLLFTAEAYRASAGMIVACDQSLDMLRRAQMRLARLPRDVRERVTLVQADLTDMPFHAKSFQTVLCMNVLHHCAGAGDVVRTLGSLLSDGGHFYLTSLVINSRLIGDWYLNRLHRLGWFASPRTSDELRELLNDATKSTVRVWTQGNMAYAASTDR